jgi:hypothetical protein
MLCCELAPGWPTRRWTGREPASAGQPGEQRDDQRGPTLAPEPAPLFDLAICLVIFDGAAPLDRQSIYTLATPGTLAPPLARARSVIARR